MLVVCDTSPLSNLAIIGRLELLREQFEVVRMPSQAARELTALRHQTAQSALASAVQEGWLIEMPLPELAPNPDALHGLDAGETDALRLAIAIGADAVFLDEKEGRQRAALLRLRTSGVIGVLIVAKRAGRRKDWSVFRCRSWSRDRWPERTFTSSSSGQTLLRIPRNNSSWSPPGRSLQPMLPAKRTSPPKRIRSLRSKKHRLPSQWPGTSRT